MYWDCQKELGLLLCPARSIHLYLPVNDCCLYMSIKYLYVFGPVADIAGILTRLGTTPSNPPLAFCHGDCDYDSDCQDDLVCYQNENGAAIVPYGCKGSTTPNWDYCYALEGTVTSFSAFRHLFSHDANPPTEVLFSLQGQLVFVGPEPISVFPLGRCQGDCDKDSECGSGLSCFFNSPGETKVPEGCSGTAVESSDYCYEPSMFIPAECLIFSAEHLFYAQFIPVLCTILQSNL